VLGELSSIRLRDLEIFIEVARVHSIREVARRLQTSSGQVSKAVQALEKKLATRLFRRSVSGVLLTSQGTELLKLAQDLILQGEKMSTLAAGRDRHKMKSTLSVAGTSFLNTHFTTPLVCRVSAEIPNVHFRFLDLPPDQIVSVGLRGGFEMAVHIGTMSWPATWTTRKIGKARWLLVVRKSHPLAGKASLRQILTCPFVVPTYWTSEGLTRGNDQFPIPLSKRKAGFETATAEAAIPILLETDHCAFLPEILVKSAIADRQLVELTTTDLPKVEKDLYLSAKSDSVPAAVFQKLCKVMSENLV